MQKCAFCDYPDFEHQIVYKSSLFIVIQARRPLSKGHIIIFPKRHTNEFSFNQDESIELFNILDKFVNAFKKKLSADGVNVFSNIGKAAGQEIPHIHIHVVSRFGDELESPFNILLDKEKMKELHKLTPSEMASIIQLLTN